VRCPETLNLVSAEPPSKSWRLMLKVIAEEEKWTIEEPFFL
jgi:hypothetical protein